MSDFCGGVEQVFINRTKLISKMLDELTTKNGFTKTLYVAISQGKTEGTIDKCTFKMKILGKFMSCLSDTFKDLPVVYVQPEDVDNERFAIIKTKDNLPFAQLFFYKLEDGSFISDGFLYDCNEGKRVCQAKISFMKEEFKLKAGDRFYDDDDEFV